MNTLELEMPKGLSAEVTNVLNAISQRSYSSFDKNKVIIEFIGVADNWQKLLLNVRCRETIKVLTSK
ncbi:hypothetical protein OZ664_11755 [Elizabethkingia sp. HX WHF]|uniref:Uncharacterized protein n=1 Tax=Elizabethkingia miricola TaxID=172045 RepID=A0ABY3NBA4_ELIMR|nr:MULTISPECIES: hypothetical protein [Elizabethkingia]MDX8564675.1 hypothetical protein [Elizabethkingia sp. HX WHF]OBS12781.1 hypothetical protein ATE49_15530 [Elizabethkingia miricola]TYO83107.1 hypothetical protein LX74_04078 [Elizabethkingia miricola]